MLAPLLTCFFMLTAAEPTGNWSPVGEEPASATIVPAGNMILVAPAEEPIAVVPMHPIPTSRGELQAQTAGFRNSGNEASKRQGWFPKLFRGELWKKTDESPSPEAPSVRDRLPSALLESRPSEPASDSLLLSRCRALLHQDQQLSGSTIQVHANQGTLYLRGTVSSEILRHRAEQIAWKTDGARGIVNEVRVYLPEGNWFQHSAVTLSTPRTATGEPLASRVVPPVAAMPLSGGQEAMGNAPVGMSIPRSESFPLPAFAGSSDSTSGAHAADQFVIPPSPVGINATPRLASADSQDGFIASVPATSRAWVPNVPTKAIPTGVQLGRPEVLTTRPGLPTVTTYLIRRTDESGWDNGATLRPNVSPDKSEDLQRSDLREPAVGEDDEWVRPTARFVIPAPTMRGPTRTAKLDAQPIPTPMQSPIQMPIRSTAEFSTPTTFGTQRGLRSDVDAILDADPYASSVGYRVEKGELVLFGEIPSANTLYALAYRLGELPGVDMVSFDRLRIRD